MQTVYDFELPKGYIDNAGEVHKFGKMRLATAGDEINATRDPRVLANPSYLTIAILGKVVTEIEGVTSVSSTLIERLFTADLAFLQDMYQRINDVELPVMTAVCPDCGKTFEVPVNFTREG
ncbi:MAG: phage tail assembly protein [Lachnospiraceae bacterium]|nr:phage tail assembly protein [Lachnospiraceae bacterium]MBQ6089965.1 phage tail assembly protein [Lachnospiraceae bacterium]MBR5368418.1 phage tail assembly protein [Lachnospiraceae bacterium]